MGKIWEWFGKGYVPQRNFPLGLIWLGRKRKTKTRKKEAKKKLTEIKKTRIKRKNKKRKKKAEGYQV